MNEIGLTWICKDCGEEVPGGLMNVVDHEARCKRNSPSESIDFHQRQLKIDKIAKERRERMRLPLMNQDERVEYFAKGVGMRFGNSILLGSARMDALLEFEDRMILKYGQK